MCLERINEEDETILESLVMNHMSMSGSSGSGVVASTTTTAQSRAADDMMKRLAYLESENARLSRMLGRRNKSRDPMNTNVYCPTCSTRIGGAPGGVIFDHDDEGLVLTAVDDDEDDEEEHDAIDNDDDDPGFEDATVPRYAGAMSRDPTMTSSPPTSLTEMQRKVLHDCLFEFYLFVLVHSDDVERLISTTATASGTRCATATASSPASEPPSGRA